jgi:hypothetical protein
MCGKEMEENTQRGLLKPEKLRQCSLLFQLKAEKNNFQMNLNTCKEFRRLFCNSWAVQETPSFRTMDARFPEIGAFRFGCT